jgi:hypothetical protein
MEGARPTHGEIDLSGDVQGYFAELVVEAAEERRVEANPAVTSYVAALLADYAHPGSLTFDALDRPFTLLLAEALESEGSARFERLRALGDGVLYVRGFFSEHLETRGVELRYVSSVGARAYDSAASMLRRRGSSEASSAPDVFGELAERFDVFVALVGGVADRIVAQSGAGGDGSVLKLYERWLRTGSNELAVALGQRGLVPLRTRAGLA